MNLDEAQKKKVTSWIAEGLNLAEIQKRLGSELGLNLTYMEVRMLVDDLKLTPKDVERVKPAELSRPAAPEPANAKPGAAPKNISPLASQPTGPAGDVSVTVDEIARPGTVASGNVTFTDGQGAEWYLDQNGRLGLMPKQKDYRPSQQDVMAFQAELQNQLASLGF
jgi:hypothetical protein